MNYLKSFLTSILPVLSLICYGFIANTAVAQSFSCNDVSSTESAPIWEYHFATADVGEQFSDDKDPPVALLDDVNADGIADVAVGGKNLLSQFFVEVLSGADGTLLYRVNGIDTPRSILSIADVNADGVKDFLIQAITVNPGKIYQVSGADGSILDTENITHSAAVNSQGGYGDQLTLLSDITNDQIPEFASFEYVLPTSVPTIVIRNGLTLDAIISRNASDYSELAQLYPALNKPIDIDEDGNLDIVVRVLINDGTQSTPDHSRGFAFISGATGNLIDYICSPAIPKNSNNVSECAIRIAAASFSDRSYLFEVGDIDSDGSLDFIIIDNTANLVHPQNTERYVTLVTGDYQSISNGDDSSIEWVMSYDNSGVGRLTGAKDVDFDSDNLEDIFIGVEPNTPSTNIVPRGYMDLLSTGASINPSVIATLREPAKTSAINFREFPHRVLSGLDLDADGVSEIIAIDVESTIDGKSGKGIVTLFPNTCTPENFEAWMYPVVIDC